MAHIREIIAAGVPARLARMLGSNRLVTVEAGGTDQASAIPLSTNFCVVTNSGPTTQGVRVGAASGAALTALYNAGPNNLQLYPDEGEAFQDLAFDVPLPLLAFETALLVPAADAWLVAGAVPPGARLPPGGVSGQLQVNVAGTFGGMPAVAGDATLNTATGLLILTTVNPTPGTFQGLTFDAKGRLTAALDMDYLPRSGVGGMTGLLVLSGDPEVPLGAATRRYVDTAAGAIGGPFLPLGGGILTGPLTAPLLTTPEVDWPQPAAPIAAGGLWSARPGADGRFYFAVNTAPAGDWSSFLEPLRLYPDGTAHTPMTPAATDNSDRVATTAFVKAQNYLTGNQNVTLSGDAVGAGATAIAVTVQGLRGLAVAATVPADGQLLGWSGAANSWGPVAPILGGGPPGGAVGEVQVNAGNNEFAGVPGMSGDASWNTTTGALTLATVLATPGIYQGFAVDAKGRITTAANMNYLPASGGTVSGPLTAAGGLTASSLTAGPTQLQDLTLGAFSLKDYPASNSFGIFNTNTVVNPAGSGFWLGPTGDAWVDANLSVGALGGGLMVGNPVGGNAGSGTINAEQIRTNGQNAGYGFSENTATSAVWWLRANAGSARIQNPSGPDVLLIDTAGNLTVTGGVIAAGPVSAPSFQTSGATAMLAFDDREGASNWGWYSTGNIARLWNSVNGDRLTVAANGTITMIKGPWIMAGDVNMIAADTSDNVYIGAGPAVSLNIGVPTQLNSTLVVTGQLTANNVVSNNSVQGLNLIATAGGAIWQGTATPRANTVSAQNLVVEGGATFLSATQFPSDSWLMGGAVQMIAVNANNNVWIGGNAGSIQLFASLISQASAEFRSNAFVRGNLEIDGGVYTPGASDPLRVLADQGQYARAVFTVAGIRQWSAGCYNSGIFGIADESAAAVRLQIDTAGNATLGAVTAPSFTTAGGYVFQARDNAALNWQWYANAGAARLFLNGDRFRVDTAGNVITGGSMSVPNGQWVASYNTSGGFLGIAAADTANNLLIGSGAASIIFQAPVSLDLMTINNLTVNTDLTVGRNMTVTNDLSTAILTLAGKQVTQGAPDSAGAGSGYRMLMVVN